MPLYEYRCQDCSHHAEMLMRRTDAECDVICEKCGGIMIRQLTYASISVVRTDLDWFGTPQHAEASAKRAGVET